MLTRLTALALITWTALFCGTAAAWAEEAHGSTQVAAETGNADLLNPVDWRTDLAIWTLVLFLLVLAILKKYAWGPISEGLQKRENGIVEPDRNSWHGFARPHLLRNLPHRTTKSTSDARPLRGN